MAYASLAELKEYRGISSSVITDDGLLGMLLTHASRQIDGYTGRTFGATATATRTYDAVRDVSPDKRTLYLDDDLCEVTTITNGTGNAVTKYVTEPQNVTPYYAIRLKASAGEVFTYEDDPEDAITVRGKWGYSETPPADIRHATIRLAAYMYAQKDSSVFDTTAFPEAGVMTVPQGMPRDVREILDHYRKVR